MWRAFFTLFENMANNMETVPAASADENIEASNNTKAKKTATKTIWTDDIHMVETLIEAYQEHECLWNMSAAEYKDKQKRSLAYEAVDLNLDIYEIKRSEYCTKWTNLRTQFLREHNNYTKRRALLCIIDSIYIVFSFPHLFCQGPT